MRRKGTPREICWYMSLVEQKISFQMITNMLGSDKYKDSYKPLNILHSGHIERGKQLILYHLFTTTNYDI